jgi:hypothetical protein
MLNLVLFTSTKGHFGNKEIYRRTISDLFSKISPDLFFNYAHIKVSSNEEVLAEEMELWLKQYNFHVDKTFGNWSHSDHQLHGFEYTKDRIKAYSNALLNKNIYTLNLEDDWLFNVKTNDLKYYIDFACRKLDRDPHLVQFRFNHEIHKIIEEDNINEGEYYVQTNLSTPYGSTFTFQPSITRTRDNFVAYNLIKIYYEQIKQMHIELQSGWAYKHLSNSEKHFAFFNPKLIDCTHIGVKSE